MPHVDVAIPEAPEFFTCLTCKLEYNLDRENFACEFGENRSLIPRPCPYLEHAVTL